MSPDSAELSRLARLSALATLELQHLQVTDGRLFAQTFTAATLAEKCQDVAFSEQLDAFVARFGRLQDLLGDKFLPAWLRAMEEPPGTALENLDKAEKLGLVSGADAWFAVRKLRNLMVHEYLQEPEALFEALMAAHEAVPMLRNTCRLLVERSKFLLE